MPMEAKAFLEQQVAPKPKKKGVNQETIFEFLNANPSEAYSQTEIFEATGIKYQPSVNCALHSLKQQSKIICRVLRGKMFWAVNPDAPIHEGDTKDTEVTDGETGINEVETR